MGKNVHEHRGTLGRHWKDNEQKGKMRALEPALDSNEVVWDIRLQLFIAPTYLFTITIQETQGEPSFHHQD